MAADLAHLIPLAAKGSIMLLVFGFALAATVRDATYFTRHPRQMARALASLYVVMPALALALSLTFDLKPEIKLALFALALSPVPPFLPGKALKAGGETTYTFGLLLTSSLLAIVIAPLVLYVIGAVFSRSLVVPPLVLAEVIGMSVLAPLVAGIALHAVAPNVAVKLAKPVLLVGHVVLVACLVPILIKAWPAMLSEIGHGTLFLMIAFVAVGLAAGHLLGGPIDDDRPVLAIATSARHPAAAIAIAHTIYPDVKLAGAAVLLYLLVGTIATIPYLAWIKRRHATSSPTP